MSGKYILYDPAEFDKIEINPDEITRLRAENAKLREALNKIANKAKVFHDYVEDYPIMFGAEPPLRVGDLRAARAALGENDG